MTTEKKNYCDAAGLCGVVMHKSIYGTDCKHYEPDNRKSCYHASWGHPVQCTNKQARDEARTGWE